ncbi:MAG: UDP-N-acetylglucosamine 2-epimerase (non-hydrolyzing) [Balneola sp.]
MKNKVVTIVGARPQFIKLAPLSKNLRKHFEEIIVHTGQHYDEAMSKIFFDELEIKKPDYNLGVGSGSHAFQTAQMMIRIEEVLINEKPSLVIVFGDTNSTLAASLVTSKMGIKTVHVEAGLRSFNRSMPEELNRITTDHLSDYLFAPTNTAVKNLINEGLKDRTENTGDIMVDSVSYFLEKSKIKSNLLNKLGLVKNGYYLMTLHRPSTVDDIFLLRKILNELINLGKKIVFPVHPRTRKILGHIELPKQNNFIFLNPVGYLDFISLMSNADKIITDSGGIQKEAYILKTPCITLRTETEWVETVENGWNLLLNPHSEIKFRKIENFKNPDKQKKLFGENPSTKMINKLLEIF